ncbi:hypothetical protein R3P38DRAFT_1416261 [Favolaschia claudopus]|uniref:Uncharacterized protein n=1 Tax=Favolaschia claudopus TaxID=2862362 RepID=A0AAW0AQW1_9AGAR
MANVTPSPAIIPDSEADESRVYFGAFKSPEKKYLAAASLAVPKPQTPSPLRRSPRLSSPIPGAILDADTPQDANFDEQDTDHQDGDFSRSRSGTPDNDRWQGDEPSSVLATRIARAHDNPSPPPAPHDQDFDSAPSTPPIYHPHPIPFVLPIPDSPSPRSRNGSPLVALPRQSNAQQDLISFDSFSTSIDLTRTQPVASTSSAPHPQPHIPSVDELLTSWSPSARNIPTPSVSPCPSDTEGDDAKGKRRADGDLTSEAAEEQRVAEALILPATDADVAPSILSAPSDVIMIETHSVDNDAVRTTPLRRSTRPRRSTTPHLVPLPSSDDESPSRPNLTPLAKKRKKAPERSPLVPLDTDGQSHPAHMTGGSPVTESDREMEKRREREERKQAKAKATGQTVFHRQLGSLSPGSANVLTQLLPQSGPSPLREPEELQHPFSFSVFSANPAPSGSVPTSSPIRASPARVRPGSPTRVQFQMPSLDDPNATPARRIPVEQPSVLPPLSPPQRGNQLFTRTGDSRAGISSRTPVFNIPAQDSPARRVNINVVPPSESQSKYQGMRFGSPTRAMSRERSGSVEPRPPWNTTGPATASSSLKAPSSASLSSPSRSTSPRLPSAPIRQGKLPFPVPLTPSGSGTSLKSAEKVLSPSKASSPPPSPALGVIKIPRSNLKQPTSRIPRIGTKPYARPAAAKSAGDKAAKLSVAPAPKAVVAREPLSRTIKVARTGSGSSSDDAKPPTAGPSNLKRKRVASPQSQRPIVLIRQVPSKPAPPKAPTVQTAPSPLKRPPSPVKKPVVTKFRMVDLHARPPEPESKMPEPDVNMASESTSEVVTIEALPSSPIAPVEESLNALQPPLSSPEISQAGTADGGSVRRTTRVRKSVFPQAVGPSAPLPSRRKPSFEQQPVGSGVFAGMSAVALRALTSSNTTRNQRYLAAKLETEVIRKEGARPESPAPKMRTIAQREQDAKGSNRRERAARRARRVDDPFSENEWTSDLDQSMTDTDVDSSPVRRHKLGPGDEEEYQTPKVNGTKRERSNSMGEDAVEKKRVKWDRGLSTAVYLDEVEPRTKARSQEIAIIKKGCLTPAAKAIRLDPLGNHPNAESPLKDLVEENVVVKRFVYDTDEVVAPLNVVKNTRSKSKKKS